MTLHPDCEPFRRANSHSEGFGIPWEPGCPLLVSLIDIARNPSTGEGVLDVKASNISKEIIRSVTATVTITYASGKQEVYEYDRQDLNLQPAKMFSLGKIKLASSNIVEVAVVVERVLTTARTWETHGPALPIESGAQLNLPDKVMEARLTLLKEAGCTHVSSAGAHAPIIGENWWICSCGYPNSSTDDCVFCRISKADAQNLCDPAEIARRQELLNTEQKVLLESLKGQEKQKRRRKKITLTALAATLLCCTGLAAYYFLSLAPALAYDEALEIAAGAEKRGDYAKASEAFDRLGDYRDSKQQAVEAELNYIEELVMCGQYEHAASWISSRPNNPKPDWNLINSSAEARAQRYFDEGRYASAAAWFVFVGDDDRSNEAKYQYVTSNIDGDFSDFVLLYLEDLASMGYADSEELLESYSAQWSDQIEEGA